MNTRPAERPGGDLAQVIRDFRREQVVEAARQLFAERRSMDVSMEEVAARAGVSRSTVYKHFSSRDEVLQACLGAVHRQLVDGLGTALAGDEPVADQLASFVRVVLETIDDHAAFYGITLALQHGPPEEGEATRATIGVVSLEVATILEGLVVAGLADGTFRPADPARVMTLIGYVLFGAVSARADDPSPPPAAEAAAELRDLLLTGLSGPGRPGSPSTAG